MKHQTSMGRKILNYLLGLTFVVTMMVPLTGVHLHKLASLLFLILCVVHTILYRKKMGAKRYALLAVVFVAFFSGIFGMIYYMQCPLVMQFHRAISITSLFFLAIHIFVFHKRLQVKSKVAVEK